MNKPQMEGTAYGRPQPTFDERLVRVGPGTPMGEMLRRYWHPVGLAQDANAVPRKIRALGEDLILFRDGAGRAGLLYPRCAHRGTNLYYGKVEERGIRCCYHGWLYDVQGHCLEQPCEPCGGALRDEVRQPWYAVREQWGLVFAYMGPPDRMPAFPVFKCFTDLAEGEHVVADDTSIGSGGGVIVPCNWTHAFENVVDPFHVPILHGSISGLQFTDVLSGMPSCKWSMTKRGVRTTQDRVMPDGRIFRRITEAMLPTVRLVGHPRPTTFEPSAKAGWILPIDDTTHRIYTAARVKGEVDLALEMRQTFNGRGWHELTEAEHRAMPGDWEAQVGQGEITFHSEERLATTDQGVGLLRRLMRKQVDLVAGGDDPINAVVGPDEVLIEFEAGNYLVEQSSVN